jgi:hypothetical protein
MGVGAQVMAVVILDPRMTRLYKNVGSWVA